MEYFYRLLGLIASLLEGLSRQNISFVPAHWFLLAMSGGIAGAGAAVSIELLDRIEAGDSGFETVAMQRIFEKNPPVPRHAYITVQGVLLPEHRVYYGRGETAKRAQDLEYVLFAWAPIVDPTSRRGIFVQFRKGPESIPEKKPDQTITGRLEPIPPALLAHRNAAGPPAGGYRLNREFVLREGEPMSVPAAKTALRPLAAGAIIAGLFFAFGLYTMLRGYVIFRRVPYARETKAPALHLENEPIPLRATGRFATGYEDFRKYRLVPTNLTFTNEGELHLEIDTPAAAKLDGFETDASGMLKLSLHGQLQVSHGRTYNAGDSRPALKLRAKNGPVTILSFERAQDLERTLARIRGAGGAQDFSR